MSVSTIEGKTRTAYKTEDFFAAIAVLGDELDCVKFVGLYNEDDLVELTSIFLTGMSSEEVSHARAELYGDDYDDVWTPAEK